MSVEVMIELINETREKHNKQPHQKQEKPRQEIEKSKRKSAKKNGNRIEIIQLSKSGWKKRLIHSTFFSLTIRLMTAKTILCRQRRLNM